MILEHRNRVLLLLPILTAFVFGCAKEPPKLVFESQVVGDGGLLIRDLYRSYWLPPASDEDSIRVGLLQSKKSVRFKAKGRMRIKALSENTSWEVSSPEGVIWEVVSQGVRRPAVLSHYSAVEQKIFSEPPRFGTAVAEWRSRGFPSARWIGPPSMDRTYPHSPLERWILSLTPATSEKTAKEICQRAKREFESGCTVVSRVELPPIGHGIVRARNSNFEKPFEGVVELVSTSDSIEVQEIVPEERTGETSNELYGPKLVVAFNPEGDLSLVQMTKLGDYLKSVVPSEIFPQAPIEALKAQAVVARTYAARYHTFEYSDRLFSICASTMCQVYRGIPYRKPGPSKAVEETHDLIVKDASNEPADTYYHAICGGHTEANSTIFGSKKISYLSGSSDMVGSSAWSPITNDDETRRYLNAEPASYCGLATLTKKDRWRWNAELDSGRIKDVLKNLGLSPPLRNIVVERRGISGRALVLMIETPSGKKRISGELEIRKLLGGLLSSVFVLDVERSGDEITKIKISGGGYGHGVGMCQMGAIGRAEAGQDFSTILRAYYPGTNISPMTSSVSAKR